MTDLIPYDAPQITRIETAQDIAVHRLAEWAQSADAAYKVATRLVESSFVPQGFRGKPVEATAAILAGIEVGLSPMSALRAFDVIQGQAAARAITLRAIVQSHGHEMILLESNDTRCRMKGRRRGADEWQNVTWTIDRAKTLGLVSKDNWKKQPGAMLVARATSELARLIASDAILGIAYSAEEIADGGTTQQAAAEEAVTPQQPSSGARRMSRKAPETPAEPTFTEPEPEVPAETGEGITRAQSTKLHAVFGDLGITDRADKLSMVSRIVGRQVESSSDLTKAEASSLIEQLQAEVDNEAEAKLAFEGDPE